MHGLHFFELILPDIYLNYKISLPKYWFDKILIKPNFKSHNYYEKYSFL